MLSKPLRLIITLPPQHGKSEMVSHWTSVWFLTNCPQKHVILGSYGQSLATYWGQQVRDTIAANEAELGIQVARGTESKTDWSLQQGGGMLSVGVGGPVTGRPGNLVIIDDPVKNPQEAESLVYRNMTWDWWLKAARTRLQPGASVVVITTRWHLDDLAGRMIESGADNFEVINLPALAEDNDPLGRLPGEALWPDRFSLAYLLTTKEASGSYNWSALYQQRPIPEGGGIFKRQWFQIVDAAPTEAQRVRYWDFAGTERGGDYTVGTLLTKTKDNLIYVEDVVRGQWGAMDVEAILKQTAQLDASRYHNSVEIRMEQEPGSSGKSLTSNYIRLLSGYPVKAQPSTGSKELRARPFAAQCEAGNVKLVKGAWNGAWLDEVCRFPTGTHDDQVDSVSGAFAALTDTAGEPKEEIVVYDAMQLVRGINL